MLRAIVVVVACSTLGLLLSAEPAASQGASRPLEGVVEHVRPVSGPVIDPFRPPPQPWLPGNRGLEFATTPGEPVLASAAGLVTFAGQVGGNFFVTVRHEDGIRTTVGFVAETHVARGEWVRQGTLLATAGESIHFTARRGDQYLDPELLFVRVIHVVRLVPIE